MKPAARWLGYDWAITDVAIPLGYEDGKPDAYQWEHQQLYVSRILYEVSIRFIFSDISYLRLREGTVSLGKARMAYRREAVHVHSLQ